MPHIKYWCHSTSEVFVVPILVFLADEKSRHLKIRWRLRPNSHAKCQLAQKSLRTASTQDGWVHGHA